MPGNLFATDYNLFGHLAEDSVIKCAWEFMTNKGIVIEDEVGGFSMLREKDVPISVYLCNAFNHKLITTHELKRANICRKYLRALTVADIATGDGKSVTDAALNGIRSNTTPRQIQWYEQGKPNAIDWSNWRTVLE